MNFDFDQSICPRYPRLVLDIRGSFGATVNVLIDARGVYLILRVQEPGVNRTTCNVLSAKISSRS